MDNMTATGLKFRWINGQCFEFQFPNGKTLLTDPWLNNNSGKMKGPWADAHPAGFTVEDLEGCDYLFLNHGHGDHTANLQEVIDRFHPVVIAHSANCMQIAKDYDIALTSIYPVDFGDTYYFDGFTLDTYHGTHHGRKENYERAYEEFQQGLPGSGELNALGSIFNMNFVLTTDQGFTIAFIGGNDDGMLKRLQGKHKPNLILRNKMGSSAQKETAAKMFADWFKELDAPLLVPMHYENWIAHDPEFTKKFLNQLNVFMEESGQIGRFAPMERTRWYRLNLSITAV